MIDRYSDMWKYLFVCATKLKLNKVYIFNVGGGAFAPKKINFTEEIFKPSFEKIRSSYPQIKVLNSDFNGQKVPELFSDAKPDILYVNAWDPWSIIGNGNERDNSLDGSYGRCSNMSVLGWSVTNTKIKYHIVR